MAGRGIAGQGRRRRGHAARGDAVVIGALVAAGSHQKWLFCIAEST
jgi:hypothetical protein